MREVHPLIGRRYRVLNGETGWQLAPQESDYEVATVVRVCPVGQKFFAHCVVTPVDSATIVGRPAFYTTDLEEKGELV